jgi:hypothetical protein
MTDVVTLEPPPPAEARCANCGAALHGPFCSACGQAVKPLDPPARHFIGEFAQVLFDVDNRVLRSLRRLFLTPGFLTREYFAGRRARWVSPLKLYLSTSVACFAVLAVIGDSGVVRLTATGDPNDASGFAAYGYRSLEDMRAATDAAQVVWMPRVMFVLVPFVAWLVARARRGSGRRYPAHLVFTLHLYAAGFGVRAVTASLGAAGPSGLAEGLAIVTVMYVAGYTYLALRRAYGIGRGVAVRDTAIVTLGSWLALMVGTGAVVVLAVFGRYWLKLLGF